MKKSRSRRALPLLGLVVAFVAGVAMDATLRVYGPPLPASLKSDVWLPSTRRTAEPVQPRPVSTDQQARLKPNVTPTPSATAGTSGSGSLLVPIDGISADSFKGGFVEVRGQRPHEAVDILAPRNTPIRAAEDGTIVKLFLSKPGGTTIYEFDSEQRLSFYYAHLERYADGLHEGQHVSQGEVIGYVGTSGNAPPNTPHLHFAIFQLNADHHWWQGTALDPYLVYRNRGLGLGSGG